MATAILFDREDASNFLKTRVYSTAFALTPSAIEAAQTRGIPLVNDNPIFSRNCHARCAAAARRAVRDFDTAIATSGLSPSITVMARQSVWGHASLVHRLKLTLPAAPWIVRQSNGDWIVVNDWEDLHKALLPRIWNFGLAHRVEASRPPLPRLYSWLNRLLALVAKNRSGPWIASSSRKLKNGLQEALLTAGTNLAVFQPTEGAWNEYRALFNSIRKAKPVETFRISPLSNEHPGVERTLKALRCIGESFSDPRVRSAWELYAPYFAKAVPAMLGIVSGSIPLLHALGARAVVTFEANSWLAAPLMEAAGKAGIKRVVFNHNSHPLSGSPVADSVLDTLLRQRTWNELTDVAAVWSPFSLAALRAISTTGQQERILPVRLGYPTSSRPAGIARPLRILHAGNYQNWSDFFPWIAETASEYLNGVEALAATVEKMDGIELVVRVRPKREVDAQTVKSTLGNRRNVTVCGTDENFLEQLANSDLLIAHFSTTVEQALQMGKPVLLWGSTDRYQQFPGQESPPEGKLAGRVYVGRKAAALPAMLAGMRDALQAPSDSETITQAYAFGTGTPGVAHLASFLIDPSPIHQGKHP